MLKVSSSLPDIAVLRGGDINFKKSLEEGGEVLTSLTKLGYTPIDVLISKDGSWTSHGSPTEAHKIYTHAHTIVDTTRMKHKEYQALAKRMRIPLIFSEGDDIHMHREDLYRILRQQDIKVPDTFVIRAHDPLKKEIFREIWLKYHTPLLVRPLHRHDDAPSALVKKFPDLEKVIREYHEKGIDVHVLTYKKSPMVSVAALPHFRNEEVYMPLWVDVHQDGDVLPSRNSSVSKNTSVPEFRKEHIKKIVTKVYKALGITTPACIDLIHHNNDYIVVNVDTQPSLTKESRFLQSLSTTGVNIGHYIHACITNDIK